MVEFAGALERVQSPINEFTFRQTVATGRGLEANLVFPIDESCATIEKIEINTIRPYSKDGPVKLYISSAYYYSMAATIINAMISGAPEAI